MMREGILKKSAVIVILFAICSAGCGSRQTDLIKKAKMDARDLILKGNESLSEGKYTEAARYYDRARFVAISIDDLAARSDADNNLGQLYLLAGDMENAGRKFQEAYEWSEECGYISGIAASENGLGLVELQNGNYEQARTYLEGSLEKARAPALQAAIKSNLGNLERLTGDLDSSRLYLGEAFSGALKTKRHKLAAAAAYRMALLEKSVSNFGDAIRWAKTALAEDKKVEFSPGIVKDLELLSDLSMSIGDDMSAGLYRRRAHDAKIVLTERFNSKTGDGE